MFLEFYCPLPPTTNKQVAANRSRSGAGRRQKSNWTDRIALIVKGYEPPQFPNEVYIHCHFLVKNQRRDRDNIEGSRKFIFDALKQVGVIVDDSKKYVLQSTNSHGIGADEVLVTVSDEPIAVQGVA